METPEKYKIKEEVTPIARFLKRVMFLFLEFILGVVPPWIWVMVAFFVVRYLMRFLQ